MPLAVFWRLDFWNCLYCEIIAMYNNKICNSHFIRGQNQAWHYIFLVKFSPLHAPRGCKDSRDVNAVIWHHHRWATFSLKYQVVCRNCKTCQEKRLFCHLNCHCAPFWDSELVQNLWRKVLWQMTLPSVPGSGGLCSNLLACLCYSLCKTS